MVTDLVPFGRQNPSENSQFDVAAVHGTGPCGPSVSEFLQAPVVRLHGPSPFLPLPSIPPPQV